MGNSEKAIPALGAVGFDGGSAHQALCDAESLPVSGTGHKGNHRSSLAIYVVCRTENARGSTVTKREDQPEGHVDVSKAEENPCVPDIIARTDRPHFGQRPAASGFGNR